MALAPEIASFGDGNHQDGETGLTILGGGFGAFPGSAWIYQNADRTGLSDQLTVGTWNDIELSGVEIPATPNNAAGTVYLFVQHESTEWSQGFQFTLSDAGGADTTPDQFTFTDQSGVAVSSTITSAPTPPITGIDTTVTFTATGGTIDVNEDGNFQTSRDVVAGDTLRARHTSSASYLTTVNTLVEGGGVSDTFSSQTQPDPSVSEPRGLGRLGIRLGVGE